MSSIATAVFKATIGLLVNKGREKAAERLKEGDVTDQKFRGFIVREIDDIKSKLDGLARKDLQASISFFKEGIELLYVVFDKARDTGGEGAATIQAAVGKAGSKTFSLAEGMRRLKVTGLNESAATTLANAKDRFKDARREATKAFANEALELSDRILAMQYRVMATILEAVDNPVDALAACRVCIEELHFLPAVQKSFKVEFKKGFWARFNKAERRQIICTVYNVNRVIYDITLMAACHDTKELSSNWPGVDNGEEQVNPLLDTRVNQTLCEQGMEYSCVTPWSFGQEGKEEHKLMTPSGIVIRAHGQFLVANNASFWPVDKSVKIFDSSGKFLHSIHPQINVTDIEFDILDVATDANSNTYVMVRLEKSGILGCEWDVQVFSSATELLFRFPLRRDGFVWRLTVSDNKVLVLRESGFKFVVDVYEHDGRFVFSFGEGILKHARDITAANDVVMVMDIEDSCIHEFTEEGQHLSKFNIKTETHRCYRIACHPAGQHVVVAALAKETARLSVVIYTKEGEIAHSFEVDEEQIFRLHGITMTWDGRIAVAVDIVHGNSKVIVL